MKYLMTLLASVGLLASPWVLADREYSYHKHKHRHHQTVYERTYVYERPAQPVYREVAVSVPYESCRIERVSYRSASRRSSATGAIVGGVIGAAIGREVGGRHDAFFGGLAGAQLGQDIAQSGGRTYHEDREVCRTEYRTEYRRELVGYSRNSRSYRNDDDYDD